MTKGRGEGLKEGLLDSVNVFVKFMYLGQARMESARGPTPSVESHQQVC